MKKSERFIWIATVSILLSTGLFVIFVNSASAGSFGQPFPYMQKFMSVYNSIKTDFVDSDKADDLALVNGAIKGMLEALGDPYTQYLSPDEMTEMRTTSTGTFGGVGMIITEKDGYIGVVSPIEDTPAFRKGMKTGDLLISVDGETLKGVTVGEAAKRLKGVPGTGVKVEFLRDEIKYEVEIIRALIDVPTVKSDVINNKWGYLRITQFSGTTFEHVKEAIAKLNTKNVQGFIVDLRMNPGGLLDSVINIIDLFQDEGVIVSVKGRRLNEETVTKSNKFSTMIKGNIPVVVLIDGGSASASEMFAGAMKDNKRGVLVGEKSFGKGSVQSIQLMGDGTDGFKMTTAKYYTPSGISIHGIGIVPDIEIKEPELTDDEKETLRKLYKNKVIDDIVKDKSDISDEVTVKFIKEIQSKGYALSDNYLRRLIKNASSYGKEGAPIFDLEYDIQLKTALDLLDNNKIINTDTKYSIKK